MISNSIWLGAAVAALASAQAEAVPADFKAKADALLASAYPEAGPGAAVIVVDDGRPVYSAGRGLADVGAKRAITPATVFRLGSITKQFSAAVMLQLVAEGKVSLDDRLSKFLPDYPQPGADATIAQLLNHTVGVQSYTGIPGWVAKANTGQAYTTEQLIAEFKDKPAPSKPGEKFEYNNSGYVLVGAVIEKVTGKPWHQNVDERIAKPLSLTTIRYGVLEDETPNVAKGYTDTDGKAVLARKIHMSAPHAAGALIGSIEDLAKWSAALHHGKVIPAELYAKMIAPTVLPGGETEEYGFGIRPAELRGRPAIGHGGGIHGFSTDSVYLPQDDIFVAVFANSDDPATDPSMVMAKLAALAVGDPFPVFEKAAVDAKAVEPYLGVYSVTDGERRFFARDGKFYTQRTGGSELEAIPAGDNRFFFADSLTWFEMTRDAKGTPVMAMYQQGAVKAEESARTGPIPPEPKTADVPRSVLERYAGSYRAPMGIAKVALPAEGPMTVQLGGQNPVPLKALSETEFMTVGVDARIVFQAEGNDVKGLVLKQGGREMPATRIAD